MTNNEVRVLLKAPIILEGDKIRFDQELLKHDKNSLIKQTSGLYHASQGVIPKVTSSGLFTITDDIDPASLPCEPKKATSIDTRSGVWQTYKRKVRYFVVPELIFYCSADKDFIRDTLMQIAYLGSFSSMGFGEIDSIAINEIEEDYSFVKDSILMRSIPVGVELDIDFGNDPLSALSYFQGYEDCYYNNTPILSYIPNQI